MINANQYGPSHGDGSGGRSREALDPDAVPVGLASALAGDRALTGVDDEQLKDLQARRGRLFFSDLLYAISHHYFAPEIAEGLWNRILEHKFTISERLGRNVRIIVATLDYLSNFAGDPRSLALMSEVSVAGIVNLSMRDGVTGLFNHSTFYELLELEVRNHRRYGVGVGLILVDLDDFKAVNDQWGHQEGDRVLIEMARTLNQETRDSDICCRFCGEEFAAILPFTADPREAFATAERIRVGAGTITSRGKNLAISAGVAMCDGSTQTSRSLVEKADRALHEAKRTGKNRVVHGL